MDDTRANTDSHPVNPLEQALKIASNVGLKTFQKQGS